MARETHHKDVDLALNQLMSVFQPFIVNLFVCGKSSIQYDCQSLVVYHLYCRLQGGSEMDINRTLSCRNSALRVGGFCCDVDAAFSPAPDPENRPEKTQGLTQARVHATIAYTRQTTIFQCVLLQLSYVGG